MAYSLQQQTKLYSFPNPLAHPKIKADKEKWGIPLARAIWTAYQQSDFRNLFGDTYTYEQYLKYAFGDQDKTKYQYSTDGNPTDKFKGFTPRIKDDIKNYATKRIRLVIEDLENMRYDPTINISDPGSINRKKDYEIKLRLAMEQQKFFRKLSELTGTNMFPQGVNPNNIPMDDDDLSIEMELNYKDRLASELETGIAYHLSANEYESLKSDINFDKAVIGGSVLCAKMDQFARPEISRIRPDRAIIPDSDDPYYRNMQYGGYIEYMSIADFKKNHNGEFGETEEEIIIRNHSVRPGELYSNSSATIEYKDYDLNVIPIMYFEHKTTNEIVNKEYTDKNGNRRFVEQDYDYYKTPGQQKKFRDRYGKERKLHRTPYTAIYKGYWIVNSEYMYGYGPKEYNLYTKQGGKISDPSLSFIVATPGMRDGVNNGLMKQMIPVLDDLQHDNLKIQETLSNPFPGGVQIDLFALRKAQFDWGGQKMKPDDLISMAMKNKIFIIDTSGGNYAPGSNYEAVREMNIGHQLADQIQLLQQHLYELDEIIGYNPVSSGSPNLSERTPVRVAQQQQQTTNKALGFLFKADKFIFKQLCKTLAGLHIMSVKENEEFYKKILGEESVKFLLNEDMDFDEVDWGLDIEPRPTHDEWQYFYQQLEKLEQAGSITTSDKLAIQRYTNLRKAEAYMRVMEKRRKREEQQFAMEQERARSQDVMQQNQQKAQLAIQEEQAKANTERIKGNEERTTLKLKSKLMREEIQLRESLTGVTKLEVAEQNNVAQLLQKALEVVTKNNESNQKTS